MIRNPILPGFNPDPCVCRRGDDYYLAVSTFEWLPGLPVYHAKDLKHWELLTHILTDDRNPDLRKLPSAKGIWAPCLTWCEEDGLFYCVYGVMNSMEARYFDINNYLITAPEITGPWSKPVYLHSCGFDASLFHDTDGRKWLVSLDWETRENYEKPGAICLVEYDPRAKTIVGYPRRIWWGGTDRGCIEAPHLTKRGKYYYLMCAEGGTGYNHCVSMARSTRVDGPYVKDPANPILTSQPAWSYERHDWDHLKPRYYNPDAPLQKCGHGSYVDLPNGETYLFHLCARPFVPELRCTLGRETAVQKMVWTEDGWLRMADGTNLAKAETPEPLLPEAPMPGIPDFDGFDSETLRPGYYAPRILPERFVDLRTRPGWARIRGQESRSSLNEVSILARKLTGVYGVVTAKMEFHPAVHQHSAGLILYYDNMNYLNLRKYRSESLDSDALSVTRMENGVRTVYEDERVAVPTEPAVWLRLCLEGRRCHFAWRLEGEEEYRRIGPDFDLTKYSDEYCKYGEFTGTMVGLTCADRIRHEMYADFDCFEYVSDMTKPVD
ncbi:MAG: glycoside hydrolase family 43 protein [Oscillospiraceae bacterium]|nr:glycoside hydrolase family 43 protein [Oscillospiraceae bacterium]